MSFIQKIIIAKQSGVWGRKAAPSGATGVESAGGGRAGVAERGEKN
ncbi:MAG: hypothetical protein WCT37_00980 [Patescibacteria group bacterium]